jgi:hypothetical protein
VRFPLAAALAALLSLPAAFVAQAQTQTPAAPPAQLLPSQPLPIAVLQGLDKITARIYTFEAPIDRTIGFGTLKVTARVCRKRPPEYPPESAAFLEIVEERPGGTPRNIFNGWMFASSPALNPLEHPVYDVWVIDCRAPRPAAR